MTALLEIEGLSKSFIKDNNKVNVLHEVSFYVKRGELLSIVGPSGCGKSTLLGLIAGFDKYDEGSILLKGTEISGPSPERVMVFQDFNQLFPWKTILQNVLFPLHVTDKESPLSKRIEAAKDFLKMVKLEGYENYYPHEISGGMKQKAAIARALSTKPEVLLMDEPFGSLDIETRTQLQSILMGLWKEIEATIVFVTHDITEAALISDRIIVMGQSPVSIRATVVNGLGRPRDRLSSEFIEKVKEIHHRVRE